MRSHRFHVWLASWADLVDALCSVFTAGFYNPWLGFKVRVYFDKKHLNERLNNEQ